MNNLTRSLVMLVIILSLSISASAQTAPANSFFINTTGDWQADGTCPSNACSSVALEWRPQNLRLRTIIVDNRYLTLDLAIRVVFTGGEELIVTYPPNSYTEQTLTGNVNRFVELIEIAPNDFEVELSGVDSLSFFTCECGGANPSNVFNLRPNQR